MALQAIKTSPILAPDNTRYALEQSQSKSQDSTNLNINNNDIDGSQLSKRNNISTNFKDFHRDLADGGFRGAIFGFSDGLATNLCLVIGVQVALDVGSPYHIIMTGVAGLLAGGIISSYIIFNMVKNIFMIYFTQHSQWAVVNIFQ